VLAENAIPGRTLDLLESLVLCQQKIRPEQALGYSSPHPFRALQLQHVA
jgi:hypothetical protein